MKLDGATLLGVFLPMLGTALGSGCVFLLKDKMNDLIQRALLGFASGVMVAASFWSLIVPATNMLEESGKQPAPYLAVGVILGMGLLLLLDKIVPHLHLDCDEPEGGKSAKCGKCALAKSAMLVLAVTLHNIPEGMAVGVVFAGLKESSHTLTMAGAFALSIGIAIQNFPEGAIISMPLKSSGLGKGKAFLYGALTGAVEPISSLITIALMGVLLPVLPVLLAFAAGAMLYVVVEELIPESAIGSHSNIGTIGFGAGFVLMMILDMVLG